MAKFKDLLDKNKLTLYLLIIITVFIIFTTSNQKPKVSIKPVKEDNMSQLEKLAKDNRDLRERLANLEPTTPVKIVRAEQVSDTDNIEVIDVLAEGTRLPFTTVYEDQAWIRPDYEPYWHSKPGLWSSIPDRIHSSYHHLFIATGTDGLWSEATHDSGIVEIEDKIKLPVYEDQPENTVAIIALQHQITDVLVFNNHIVLLGTPSRTGIQVLAFNKRDIINSISGEVFAQKNSQNYLFQLTTPDGYEVDYNNMMISY